MSFLLNPKFAPAWIACLSVGAIAVGAVAAAPRLITAAEKHNSASLASSRAENCRILPEGETVVLGAYYFQPTMNVNGQIVGGSVLPGGVDLCDLYGGSGQSVQGGYVQWVVQISDPTEVNKTLRRRLKEETNPDRFPQSQIRRDWSRGVFTPPATNQQPNGFFQLQGGSK